METTSFYQTEYFESHYGFLADRRYYALLSQYWREVLFGPVPQLVEGAVLDYGCGLGQVSAALPNVTLFDPSAYARDFLKTIGKEALARKEDVPERQFDVVLSSHSLEHYPHPAEELRAFGRYVKPGGHLLLALPVERDWEPSLEPDSDQHFQCWTFQTITNLLVHCGWKPLLQKRVYGPFLLRTAGNSLPEWAAVRLAQVMGRLRRAFPTMLTIAQHTNGEGHV